jgi:hypothetical protein
VGDRGWDLNALWRSPGGGLGRAPPTLCPFRPGQAHAGAPVRPVRWVRLRVDSVDTMLPVAVASIHSLLVEVDGVKEGE